MIYDVSIYECIECGCVGMYIRVHTHKSNDSLLSAIPFNFSIHTSMHFSMYFSDCRILVIV